MLQIAILFCNTPPKEIRKLEKAGPSSCYYWKLAAQGDVFYTEASDHLNCPIGAYTHGAELPENKKEELRALIQMMKDLSYIKDEDIAALPKRDQKLKYVVFAPLEKAGFEPSLVLCKGSPVELMILAEAAQLAKLSTQSPTLGRPTCAILPFTMNNENTAFSLGCIGNRVYTQTEDSDAYFAVPGKNWPEFEEALKTISEANRKLESFHNERKVAFT